LEDETGCFIRDALDMDAGGPRPKEVAASMDKVRRREAIGYVIVGLVIIGVAYVVYTVLSAKEPDSRYRNIERIRGEQLLPDAVEQIADVRSADRLIRA
jgi:hypothetical protein